MSKFGNISLIAADWGTSNLRVWGIDHEGKVVNSITNGKGMSSLCLLYTSPSPRDVEESRMPSSA